MGLFGSERVQQRLGGWGRGLRFSTMAVVRHSPRLRIPRPLVTPLEHPLLCPALKEGHWRSTGVRLVQQCLSTRTAACTSTAFNLLAQMHMMHCAGLVQERSASTTQVLYIIVL